MNRITTSEWTPSCILMTRAAESCGPKAATLARLLQAGFPVRPGAVLPTRFVAELVNGGSEDPMEATLASALAGIVATYGKGSYAVRTATRTSSRLSSDV